MIVQCESCQARFRLADEKVKPGGTKVRCSKCKEIFTVMPPEPEPAEEAVDFGSFNMEEIPKETPMPSEQPQESVPTDAPAFEEMQTPTPAPEEEPTTEETSQTDSEDVDFSAFETDSGDGMGEELADEFSFADTSKPVDDNFEDEESASTDSEISFNEEPQLDSTLDAPTDFDDAFSETDDPAGHMEFDFNEEPEAEATPTEDIDFSTEESSETSELSFGDDEADGQQDEPGEFSFGEDSEDNAFSFDDNVEESASAASDKSNEPDEFAFDNDNPFGEEASSEWSDETSGEDTSFDFEEPQFDTTDAPAESTAPDSGDDGLQFGEIAFASDSDESEPPGFDSDDEFSGATIERPEEEEESFSQKQESPAPPVDDYDDEEPLPAPPKKKSSLSSILVLLILLLVILGGAAGYLFMQEGTINLNTVGQYLPFLQEYIGEAPPSSPGDRIGINVSGSSYVNGVEGQMLVIQGAAVNNHPTTRSAITIKGVLLGAQGQTLLQQTVSCGNQLSDSALKTMPFASIEEAMNNQFGDSLSNMNVAAGTSIPFTIVFRNLPDGIVNINVEVVDSKPGAG